MATIHRGMCDLLERVVNNQLKNYEIKIHKVEVTVETFLSEMALISLKHKVTGEVQHLVIKKAPPSNNKSTLHAMTAYFTNEIHFYSKIVPELQDFQRAYGITRRFDIFARCLATCSDTGHEKLALENLKLQNFRKFPKSEPWNVLTYHEVFKMYGEFHGHFFALRHLHPNEFFNLTAPLLDNFEPLNNNTIICGLLENYIRMVVGFFEEKGEVDIANKLQKYVTEYPEILRDNSKYEGPSFTLLHGDSFPFNLMFKRNTAGQIDQIKMLNFQLCTVGCPVTDLSNCLYSCASKECLDNLDNILVVYYKALSTTLEQYGCHSETIYSYTNLKKDWLRYSRFGFIMAIISCHWKFALNESEMPNLNEITDNLSEMSLLIPHNLGIGIDLVKCRETMMILVEHMYNRGFL